MVHVAMSYTSLLKPTDEVTSPSLSLNNFTHVNGELLFTVYNSHGQVENIPYAKDLTKENITLATIKTIIHLLPFSSIPG